MMAQRAMVEQGERKVERMESALGVEGPGDAEDAEDELDMHQLGDALQPAEETAMMTSMSAERKVERMESALGVEGPGDAEDAEDELDNYALVGRCTVSGGGDRDDDAV
ncbi:hypothetical protein CYMTET_15092 [Cymbomonas tetramitiformis]|uniref:Uncharacterized protein n=1 Tax=Cymbomonas tetramitiformis TaxID=36881 RepID=A0AAE0GEZ2_9CHLO|nr:hypothetical protein CYMTET_15092 [Cymbomonas tetramitiformis]